MRSKIAASSLSGVPVVFLLIASACVGREVSLGNNSSSMAIVNPNEVSGPVTSCGAGAAHPNVCCDAQAGQGAKCGVYPNDPFHPCDTGWKTYPDPRSCCSLDDASKCAAPPPNSPAPPPGSCSYACPPGWYPIPDGCCHDNGDGSGECYGWAGSADAGVADGGIDQPPPMDAGPAPDAGFVDATPVPVDCAPGTKDVDGSCVGVPPTPGPICNTACPAGWQAAVNDPDVCCREIGPATFECFSQATGPLPPAGDGGVVDGGPAADAGVAPCVESCRAQHPSGYSAALLGLYDCACKSCSAECGSTEICSGGPSPADSCGACIVKAADSTQCAQHCTDPECIAYEACLRASCK